MTQQFVCRHCGSDQLATDERTPRTLGIEITETVEVPVDLLTGVIDMLSVVGGYVRSKEVADASSEALSTGARHLRYEHSIASTMTLDEAAWEASETVGFICGSCATPAEKLKDLAVRKEDYVGR